MSPSGSRQWMRRERGGVSAESRRLRMEALPSSATRTASRARPQVIGAELAEGPEADAQLGCYLCGRKPARAGLCEKMADEGRSEAGSH